MSLLFDRVKMTVSGTPGTGTITLGSAVRDASNGDFLTFAEAGVANSEVVSYFIQDGANWASGRGTYTSSGTTLSRDASEKRWNGSAYGTATLSLTSAAVVYIGARAADIPPKTPDWVPAGAILHLDFVNLRYWSARRGVVAVSDVLDGNIDWWLGSDGPDQLLDIQDGVGLTTGPTIASYSQNGFPFLTASAFAEVTADGGFALVAEVDGASTAAFSGFNSWAFYCVIANNPSYNPVADLWVGRKASGGDAYFGDNWTTYGTHISPQYPMRVAADFDIATDKWIGAVNGDAMNALDGSTNMSTANTIGIGASAGGASGNAVSSTVSFVTFYPRKTQAELNALSANGHRARTHERTFGAGATTRGIYNAFAFGNGSLQGPGCAQEGKYLLFSNTTAATPTVMTTDWDSPGTANQVTLPNNSTYHFRASVVARRTDADGEAAAYTFEGCIDRNASAATTALAGTPVKTVLTEDSSAWDADVSADATNGALAITVTGEASKTIRWVAVVDCVEVTE